MLCLGIWGVSVCYKLRLTGTYLLISDADVVVVVVVVVAAILVMLACGGTVDGCGSAKT